jgi:hypothetical protein
MLGVTARGDTPAVAPTGAPVQVLRGPSGGAARLPFTGADAGLAGLAGLILLVLGLLMRSTTRAGSGRSHRRMPRGARC